MEITSYQAKIIKRIFFKFPKRVVCTATTRAGKSLAMALGIILLACYRGGEKIRLIAPTLDHTKIVMGYVIGHIFDNKAFSNLLMQDVVGMGAERLKKEMTKQKLTFLHGSEIMCITANLTAEGRSLVGWGGTAVFVDEGEQISAEIMRTKVMRMLGDSPDSSIFMIGNPVTHGFMWEKAMDSGWEFMKVHWQDCVEAGRMTKEFVNERKEELTELEFKIWYDADWADESEDALFKFKWLESAKQRVFEFEKPKDEKKPTLEEKIKIVAGLDVAELGPDLTVLTIMEVKDNLYNVKGIHFWEKKDTMVTAGKAGKLLFDYGVEQTTVDANGVGRGVYDRLVEEGFNCLAHKGGKSPSNKNAQDRFANSLAEGYWRLRDLFEQKRIAIPDFPRLLKELRLMQYELSSNRKIHIIKPEKSPDFADSLMMAINTESGVVFDFG